MVKGLVGITKYIEINIIFKVSDNYKTKYKFWQHNVKNVINKVADGRRHCKENYGSANIEFFNRQKLTSIK